MADLALHELKMSVAANLRERGSVRSMVAGEPLFDQDRDAHTVYLVLSGIIKLVILSRGGGQTLLGLRGKGDLVGHYGALDYRPRAAGATALIDSDLVSIPTSRFRALLRTNSELSRMILFELAGQFRDATRHVAEMSDERAPFLMARRLVQLAVEPKLAPLRCDDSLPIVVQSPMSQRDLAAWAGVSERSAGAVLRDFRDEGLIATSRLRIDILDLNGLRVHAGQLQPRSRRDAVC